MCGTKRGAPRARRAEGPAGLLRHSRTDRSLRGAFASSCLGLGRLRRGSQALRKFGAPAEDARFHGTFSDGGELRDLGIGAPQDVVEDDGDAIIVLELVERLLKFGRKLLAREGILRVGELDLVAGFGAARLCTLVVDSVDGDAVDLDEEAHSAVVSADTRKRAGAVHMERRARIARE